MGVLNLTPDSFSDGGRFLERGAALEHARRMAAEGADILDLGAESTRPGAQPVAPDEQWRRLEPVIAALAAEGHCLSVDTANATVAIRALAAGASIVNDVSALGDPAMAKVVAEGGAGLVLMHMRGTPATMQKNPEYRDVVLEVREALRGSLAVARSAGVPEECLVCDPGLGFGKTREHNLELIARFGEFRELRRPLMVGASRKSFLGLVSGTPVDQRLAAGLAAHTLAVREGASVVRTHDVAETVQAMAVALAIRDAGRARA
ncbi:MAG: dihydropteroate synthase [Candidatus Eiseniibacteriota bacterium]